MERGTKVTLQIGDITVSWENGYIDTTLEDLFTAFEGLLVSNTFTQESIRKYIVEKGEELNNLYFKDETEN